MASEDLFAQIGKLFRNQKPEGSVHVFVLHRFLASDPAFAPFAKELSRIYDDEMVVEIWRAGLPRRAKAPYLKYAAPKKTSSTALVAKLADVEGYSLLEAEEAVALLESLCFGDALNQHYGIDPKVKKSS